MKTITVRKTYLVKGQIKSNEFEMKTIGDLNVLFDNAIKDAGVYARLRHGSVSFIKEFLNDILEDYRVMLQKEYEWRGSREQIIESIEANEYEFDENGNQI